MVLKHLVDSLLVVSLLPLVLLVVVVEEFGSLLFSVDVFCFCGIVYCLFLL